MLADQDLTMFALQAVEPWENVETRSDLSRVSFLALGYHENDTSL